MDSLLFALLVGLLQGILEWLPVSSEGAIALTATVVGGFSPTLATQFGLFLHAGTGLAALAFYRGDVATLLRSLPEWRPRTAWGRADAELSFLATGTLTSAVVGGLVYVALEDLASELTGGAFVAAIGGLLVVTGVVQRVAQERTFDGGRSPTLGDGVLVGAMQGLALLPGVSRSGTTVSALLLRGHAGEETLRLSFLLAIPASFGAGLLVLVDEGVPAIALSEAGVALAVSAVVGYLTVGALVRLVRRVAFWGVCVGFGALAVVGGLLVAV
ncbi:undecaprenyl-diphosphate phosphatase [Haloarculaceae archaeon H-GB1-1]|nr:undecaprenyl-diphosphate phosphatase [Haloarculaceae archaeon H-GB1-1]